MFGRRSENRCRRVAKTGFATSGSPETAASACASAERVARFVKNLSCYDENGRDSRHSVPRKLAVLCASVSFWYAVHLISAFSIRRLATKSVHTG